MVAFSLSPGGLLLPYHVGVLAALSYHGHLTADTHLAGSSAGAIAVAAHAVGIMPDVALEASMRISKQCHPWFLATGRLMPSLQHELDALFPKNAKDLVNERTGVVGLAHFELYPQQQPILETQEFDTRQDFMNAICASSMFPFFTSNQPFHIQRGLQTRIVVDGVFTEPLFRFGCPNLKRATDSQRTVCASVFPKELVGLDMATGGWRVNNVIAPPLQGHNAVGQVTRLARLMCSPGSRRDLTRLYEDGWKDAERWVRQEETTISEPARLPKQFFLCSTS